MAENQSQEELKRLIWVTGSKGGTGKSTFARGSYDLFITEKLSAAAFDGDRDNAQLHRHYKNAGKGVKRVSIQQRDGADEIIKEMEAVGTPIILIDVPAGGGRILTNLEEEVGFLSALSELGYQMTVVSVLSRVKDSVNQLKLAMDITEGYSVKHVAVKNLFYGGADKFRFLDLSKTKQRLLAEGGAVIEMRDLYEDTYEYIDEADLTFYEATEAEDDSHHASARKVKQWRKHFKQQVMSANGLLGL